MQASDILSFWFEELAPGQYFKKDEKLDADMISRFSEIHEQAITGQLSHWRDTPQGRLAEIIIIDQFSRNMFRGSAKSWVNDSMALDLAREAVSSGDDKKLPKEQRVFCYMPFMHSESREAHEEAVVLFKQLDNENVLKYELLHKEIIDRFGRYPYQNELLGRPSTPEELEYLENNKGF